MREVLSRDFALVWLATLGLYLGHQGLTPTLPLFVRLVGGDPTAIGTISGSYMFASAIAAFACPWLFVVVRPRRLVVIAMPLLAVGTVGYLLTSSLVGLGVFTVVRGAAFGLANTAMVLIVVDTVPSSHRASGIGVYQFAVSLASVVGMTLALWVIGWAGFRPIAISAAAVLLAGAVALATVGERRAGERHERLRLMSAMRRPGVGPPTLIFLALTAVYGAVVTFTAVFLDESGAGDPVLFFGLAMLAQVVGRPVSGRLCEHRPAATVAALGFGTSMVSVALLAVVPDHGVYLAGVLFGLGFGTGVVAIQVLLMSDELPSVRASASSLFSVVYAGGMGTGALVFGTVVGRWGHRWAYAGMALVLVPAIAALMRLARRGTREPVGVGAR